MARELLVASAADAGLLELLKGQTEYIRQMDRRLGAEALLPQSKAHIAQMETLLRHGLSPGSREPVARVLADAAALAGWQALDLGHYREAWALHETAKAAAREADDAALLAHATAQQAYALIDIGQPDQAVRLVQHAHESPADQLPALMRTWLFAAEAEAHAAAGDGDACRAALDRADSRLPADATDPELPFLFLAGAHLARWRGNCLARLGAEEAVLDLRAALASMESGFNRAEAGLLCDLALALTVRGEHEEAQQHARRAQQLAALTKSLRQRRRIDQLLRSA
ncbi:hypothetical protein JNW98_08415 [Streptomyces sp. SCA2-4]|nr:hypothetical protein [Streptomyces huiliensis]